MDIERDGVQVLGRVTIYVQIGDYDTYGMHLCNEKEIYTCKFHTGSRISWSVALPSSFSNL